MASDYASKGVAGAGLGLGIAGTALGLLRDGGLGGLFGGHGYGRGYGHDCKHDDHFNFQYMLENERRLAKLEALQAAEGTAIALTNEFNKERACTTKELTSYEIDARTCHFIPGKLYVSPNQMADPYHGSRHELLTRNYHNGCGFGGNGFGGNGYDHGCCGNW